MTRAEEQRAAVLKGASLLDTCVPDWFERIDKGKLLMAHCNKCILGQIYQSYYRGCAVLFAGSDISYDQCQEHAREHGFQSWVYFAPGEPIIDYHGLGNLWVEQIDQRLAADVSTGATT